MKNWCRINDKSIQLSNLYEIDAFKSKCELVQPLEEVFDFAIFFNSSENRTLEYEKIFKENSITNSLLVDFKNDESELKTKHFVKNKALLNSITCNRCEVIQIEDIFKYEENIIEIVNNIPDGTFRVRAKCFIDITGVPLIYSVALLKYLKMAFPSPELYLLNVSAKYENGDNNSIPQFSDGYKENIYIPGYYGNPDFSKPWLYIFLLGFEGLRSLSIYKVNEPDFVIAIIAEPGYQNDYNSRALRVNKGFLTESKIEHDKIIRIDAGDPVAICERILNIYMDFEDRANLCLVPLGTKPHAIGAGLSALIQNDISIMYQVPKSYSMSGTKAGDDMWIYRIK